MKRLHIIYNGDNNGVISVALKIQQKVNKTQHTDTIKTSILRITTKGE